MEWKLGLCGSFPVMDLVFLYSHPLPKELHKGMEVNGEATGIVSVN